GRGSRRIAARAAPSRLRTKQGPERWYSSSGRARASTDRPEPKLGCGTASVTASGGCGVPDPDPDWGDEDVVDEFRVPLRRYGIPEARHVAAVYDDVAARLLKEAS
ncbi:MAG TPA: hypothetical protein VF371_08750, partial [Candidatus Limnocylindrales bacterium]